VVMDPSHYWENPLARDRHNVQAMGGEPVVRSTNRYPNNEVNQSSGDIPAEIVESLVDGEEVIVDGFRRISILGLEMAMIDGSLRVRTMTPEMERRSDDSRRQR
jgi:hypothetical protein